MKLLVIIAVIVLLVLWMHHQSMCKNWDRMRWYISQEYNRQQNDDGSIWVQGGLGTSSFHMCRNCVQHVIQGFP